MLMNLKKKDLTINEIVNLKLSSYWLNYYKVITVSQFIRSFAEKLGGMHPVRISPIY